MSRRVAVLRSLAVVAWLMASTVQAQAPAKNALKQIIKEGNPEYLAGVASSGK
jgi:hypothetical protein